MAAYTVPFAHPSAVESAIAGGKGAALARLVEAKLPAPDGFVVTTQAFEQSLGGLLPELRRTFGDIDASDGAALERAANEARDKITSLPLSSDVTRAVHAAYEGLGGASVAVRSSATAEDMPQASFAGQYDSFLNVTDRDAVVRRILDVWASLYSAHAVAYRRRQNIPEAGMRMAVIVQEQLPAEASGVLFTRDPVSGSEAEFVVNATLGLGEGVVTGHMATDRFGLDPRTGEVTTREVAAKPQMITFASDGGIERVDVATRKQQQPALDDRHLQDLGGLARTVKDLFEGHQDIEFAVLNGAVHLLQARPVTAIDAEPEFPVTWDDPADAEHTWISMQIGQRDAVPARRLEVDASRAYAEASRVCFEETGSPMARIHITRLVNGYQYGRSPVVDEAEVTQRLERHREEVQRYADRGLSWWESEIQPSVERVLDELGRFRRRGASLGALVGHLERAVTGYAYVLGDLHWRMAASREDPMAWAAAFSKATGRPEIDSGTVVQATENMTMRMVRWLRALARLVQSDPEVQAAFAIGDYDRLNDAQVRERPAVRQFQRRFQNLLRRYGRRTGRGFGSTTNFSTPTWNMEPTQPLDLIASYAKQDVDELERFEAEARRERDREVRRIRRSLAAKPEALKLFESAVASGREYVRLMENHNHLMEQSTAGTLREAVHWVGERLVRDGMLDDPDEVMHFSIDELNAIADGSGPSDLRAAVAERQAEFERQARLKPPRTIGSGAPPPVPASLRKSMEAPAETGRDGAIIRGVAAARGRASGRARVAPSSAAAPEVEKGDILVAANAGPNWTPVFPLLGGLVLDQGAVFQHAALVAREYRIPAVIMTRRATSEIRDGQTVTVDGTEGVVELDT